MQERLSLKMQHRPKPCKHDPRPRYSSRFADTCWFAFTTMYPEWQYELERYLQDCLVTCPRICMLRMLESPAPLACHMGCHSISALQISAKKA